MTQQLELRPFGDVFFKSISRAMVLTCMVTGATENANYDIKWFDNNNREITDASGRSVIDCMVNYDSVPCHARLPVTALLYPNPVLLHFP